MSKRILVLVTLLWPGLWISALAQGSGGVRGTVADSSGAVIPGAQITVSNDAGTAKMVTSGNDGHYLLNGLAPGKYSVKVSFPGMQAQPETVEVGDSVATLDFTLRLTLERQEVTVQADVGPSVSTDPSQNAATMVLKDDTLDALSDDPDDLQADLAALAGPSAGPNAGQIYIDGFTAGDAVLPNKDAIREVRVNQNPFSPEFDAIGYGRTEILTKPGKDRLRGQVYFNYGNAIFNSRNPYAQQKPPFDLKDFGGSVGGPVTKRSSFFLEISNRDIDNGSVINGITLDPTTLAIVSPFTQVYSAPQARLRISPRIDYQLGSNNTLTFRYAITRNTSQGEGVGGFDLVSRANNERNLEHAFQATETAVLSSKVVDETHFQFLHQHRYENSDIHDPTIGVSSAFNGGGPSNPDYQYIHHHYEFSNYVTIVSGAHTWKAGIRVRAVSIQDTTHQNFDGTYTFGGAYAPILNASSQPVVPGIVCRQETPNAGCQTISSIEQYRRTLLFQQMGFSPAQIRLLGGGATQFSMNAGDPLVLVGQSDTGLFVGDDWRVKQNLTLSLGLRWETQLNIHGRLDFAPRVGFAWAPGATAKGSSPKMVFRGGFGVFYYRFNEQNILVAQRFNGLTQQQFVVTNPDFFPTVPPASTLQQFATAQAIHTVSPLLVAPYVMQSAVGVERQIPGHTTISVTYTNSHGLHQLLSRNINAPLPGTYTGLAGSGVFPYGEIGPIYEQESGGLYNQNQLVTNVNSRLNRRTSLFGFYMFNFVRSNTDGIGTYPANQYDLTGEYGPASSDVRHRASIGGSIATIWDLRFSPLIVAQTGQPFNITTSQDVFGDTVVNARPGVATDPHKPGVIATPYGLLDPNPSPGQPTLPRDFGRGPGLFSVDLRMAKTFGLGSLRFPERRNRGTGDSSAPAPAAPVAGPAQRGGIGGFDNGGGGGGGGSSDRRYSLTLSVSARNVFNHVNPGPIIGNINSPLFGESNRIAGSGGPFAGSNRRLEFQLRFAF
ncbi:MAG: carboxypeptidase-like regulatory domain-containing protein [Acidobacteriia bacterium]|nr:carboxypeptidase-like regulatory domain-containing protein [Terriglobia bacterium]